MGIFTGQRLTICLSVFLCCLTTQALSFSLKNGHALLEGGVYFSSQGSAQNIYIQDLLGDHFSVTKSSDTKAFFGIGYLLNGPEYKKFDLSYGINAFYLPTAHVQGEITQEFLYSNLAYNYGVNHFPIYAEMKADIKTHTDKMNVTLNAGIGPNFMSTTGYNDWSIDDGETYPDHAFNGRTTTQFSATAGIGLKMNHLLGNFPVEIGYRFFYLGSGSLKRRTTQLLNELQTGTDYAQSIVLTVII